MTATGNLEAERIDAEAKLEALRRKRGVARLDGEKFDNAPVDVLGHEIDALAQAEVEATHRERAAADKAIAERRRELFTELMVKEDDRLSAVGRAMSAAREFALAATDARKAAAELCDLIRRFGSPTPHGLAGDAQQKRLATYLSAVLSTIPGARAQFGNLVLVFQHFKAGDSWVAGERRELDHLKRKVEQNDKRSINGGSNEAD